MMKKRWKMKARTGAYRRRVLKEYEKIMNFENKIQFTNPSNTQSVIGECTEGSVFKNENASLRSLTNLTSNQIVNCSPSNFDITDNQSGNCSFGNHDSESEKSSCSSLDENLNNEEKRCVFREKLRKWAVESHITQTSLKDLAAIINELIPQILPTDPRTILGTPREAKIQLVEGGEYWHNGIKKKLVQVLNKWVNPPDKISLNINIDGLPLFRSSKQEFWPILCNIAEKPDTQPFVIGIYFGAGKPKNLENYLENFVKDIKEIIEEGIHVQYLEKTISVQIRCFICDSPARAYIKGVCNFNGKHGCLKCVTVGEYSHNSHTVTFPNSKCPERTDEGFRNKVYGAHHKTDSPLLRLPIDMIKQFPVGDSLHLIDLGIMKRLLTGWRDGNFGKYITKWRARDIEKVSSFLKKCKLPSEIHRAVRGLDTLAHWKGSEYRSFFYYLSIIILPNVLKSDAFTHFLMLYCGVTICSSTTYRTMLPLADKLLRHFVEHYIDFYGIDYVTSNVHNLIHVTAEVETYGPLHTFSAYPFENHLYMIKKMLRDGRKPLSQVANRLAEREKTEMRTNDIERKDEYPFVKTNKKHGNVLHLPNFKLSSKRNDRYFLTTNSEIIEIGSIVFNELKVLSINGTNILDKENMFRYPIQSSRLYIFKASILHNCNRIKVVLDPKDIKCKLVCIEHEEYQYFIPLLHTL